MICPAGTDGPGGQCDCRKAQGWTDLTQWARMICHEGKCYARQEAYGVCKGKANAYQLGDGTWCYGESRDTECLTTIGITSKLYPTSLTFKVKRLIVLNITLNLR